MAVHTVSDSGRFWVNVVDVDPEAFNFEEGDIYSDGSAPGAGWDEGEECGAAVV